MLSRQSIRKKIFLLELCVTLPIYSCVNLLILDSETEATLYGAVLLKEIRRSGKSRRVKIYHLPGEAWIVFLQHRHSSVREVRTYLDAVERGEGINPRGGQLLEAIEERIEVTEEEAEGLLVLCDQA